MRHDKAENTTELIGDPQNQVLGTYILQEMITIAENYEMTDQDIAFVSHSKQNALGKTKLILKDDGSFKRIFPHPNGDGTIKTWQGRYQLTQDSLTFFVNVNENLREMSFKLNEANARKLSFTSSFGEIKMDYIYKK